MTRALPAWLQPRYAHPTEKHGATGPEDVPFYRGFVNFHDQVHQGEPGHIGRGSDEMLAEELVQVVMERVWRYADRYDADRGSRSIVRRARSKIRARTRSSQRL